MSLAGAIIAAVAAAGAAVVADQNAKKQRHQDARQRQIDRIKQDEYAQNSISMKIQDARRAGVHPMYALGAPSMSYTPVSSGSSSGDTDFLAQGINDMGQNIDRAVSATATDTQKKMAALALAGAKTELEGKELDNAIKALEFNRLSTGPAAPPVSGEHFMPGQGNSNLISTQPMQRTSSLPGQPFMEPGAINDTGWVRTGNGVMAIPSNDVKQRIEDNVFHEATHFWRNNIMPNFSSDAPKPPKSALPKHADTWKWHYGHQAWVPAIIQRDGSELFVGY